MGLQFSTVDGARRALDRGVDYLICEGIDAGGHVQALSTLYDMLPAVVDQAKSVPVLAAGGSPTRAYSTVPAGRRVARARRHTVLRDQGAEAPSSTR
jgi:nitronate monooxygenase